MKAKAFLFDVNYHWRCRRGHENITEADDVWADFGHVVYATLTCPECSVIEALSVLGKARRRKKK